MHSGSADCGKSMYLGTYQRGSARRYLSCITYRQYGKNVCGYHSTNYKDLCNIVLGDIRQCAKMALEDPNEPLNILSEESDKQKEKEGKRIKEEYRACMDDCPNWKRYKDVYNIVLNDIRQYAKMALENPDELLTVLNEESDKQKKKEANRARDEHKTCQNRLEELDSEIVNKLCEKILIHQAEKIDGKRVQEIEIYYRFIGKIGA